VRTRAGTSSVAIDQAKRLSRSRAIASRHRFAPSPDQIFGI
jgi:hypothetical protein